MAQNLPFLRNKALFFGYRPDIVGVYPTLSTTLSTPPRPLVGSHPPPNPSRHEQHRPHGADHADRCWGSRCRRLLALSVLDAAYPGASPTIPTTPNARRFTTPAGVVLWAMDGLVTAISALHLRSCKIGSPVRWHGHTLRGCVPGLLAHLQAPAAMSEVGGSWSRAH